MKRKNVLVVSILTLTVLASSTAMAFADTGTSGTSTARGIGHKGDIRAELNLTDAQMTLLDEARTSDLKEAVANLVSAGTLTKAEGTTLISDMTAKMAARGDGPFQNLTAAQKTALEAKLQELRPAASEKTSDASHADREAVMTQAITSLVKDGVLTQAEADEITSNMPEEDADRGDGPFQNLTEKQKTALKSELETLMASTMKQLVSDGTITQDQADILLEHGLGNMSHHGKGKDL
jgi:polyhydroxyalkanoate synthesis regulator phasin